MIKKINALLGLATGALFIAHTFLMGGLMMGQLPYSPVYGTVGNILLRCFCLHVILALIIMFFAGENNIKYPKLNKSVVVQRGAALVLLVTVHFHMSNYFADGAVVAPGWFGFITELLYATAFMCHFIPSVDKGLITLGIYNKKLTLVLRIVICITFVFILASIIMYFRGGLV